MELSDNVYILLSRVNTMLRDQYPSIDELCASEDIDRQLLDEKLAAAGFTYNPDQNKYW